MHRNSPLGVWAYIELRYDPVWTFRHIAGVTPTSAASLAQCLGCGWYPWRIWLAHHRDTPVLIE